MSTHINRFAECLERALTTGLSTRDDLVSAAIAGEWLRRAVQLSTDPHVKERALIENYEQALQRFEWQDMGLQSRLTDTLQDVRDYTEEDVRTRDIEDGEERLLSIDEVLAVAIAACRGGGLRTEQLDSLTQQCAREMATLAPQLRDLWEFAEGREQIFGADPDYPMAYAWWESLAALSPSRIALAQTLTRRTAQEREAIIENVLDAVLQPETESVLETIGRWVDQLSEIVLPRPTAGMPGVGALVGAFIAPSSKGLAGPPKLQHIGGLPGTLDLLLATNKLIIQGADSLTLELVSATLSDGATVSGENVGPSQVEIRLPEDGANPPLRITLRINGQAIELPPVTW